MDGTSSADWILDKNGNRHEGMYSWEDYVSPGYFATLEIPILAGRDFNDGDTATSPKVAIVNQAFAKKFLQGAAPPLGQVFRVWNDPGKPPR
jgi:putative ABC transport system permease protein